MIVPNLDGSAAMMRFFRVLLPTPWLPMSTRVFLMKGGMRATSSYRINSAWSYSVLFFVENINFFLRLEICGMIEKGCECVFDD